MILVRVSNQILIKLIKTAHMYFGFIEKHYAQR